MLHLIMAGSAGDLLHLMLLKLKGKTNFCTRIPCEQGLSCPESVQCPVPLSSGQCALNGLLMV